MSNYQVMDDQQVMYLFFSGDDRQVVYLFFSTGSFLCDLIMLK